VKTAVKTVVKTVVKTAVKTAVKTVVKLERLSLKSFRKGQGESYFQPLCLTQRRLAGIRPWDHATAKATSGSAVVSTAISVQPSME